MKPLKLKRLPPEERAKRYAEGWPETIMPASGCDDGMRFGSLIDWLLCRHTYTFDHYQTLREATRTSEQLSKFWDLHTHPDERARIINRALARIGYRLNNPECEP